MIDTHTHLNLPPLYEDHKVYVERALAACVTRMMIVGVNIETSEKAIELAAKHPQLWAAVGIHPEERGELSVFRTQLSELVKNNRVSAIGECGLDYSELSLQGTGEKIKSGEARHDMRGVIDFQKQLFVMQAELAATRDLPLLIHCRNTRRNDEVVSYSAYDDLLVLLKSLAKCPRFVLHCASGPVAYVQAALEMGAYVSFAGNVTYPNAGSIRELLKITPLDRLLVETDAPFLSPQGKRGTQNEPANVVDTARFIAEFLGTSYEEIDSITTENAMKLFR